MHSNLLTDNKIKKYFKHLKKTTSLNDNLTNKIIINDNNYLLPLCKFYLNNLRLINDLTYYRNKYKKYYPTQFKATFTSTKKWIKKLLQTDNRIMFLLINKENEISGIIGFSKLEKKNILEIDNVIKFKNCEEKNIFSKTLKELVKFSKEILFIDNVQLKVMNNNIRAIKFYKKNHFKQIRKIPLTKKKIKNKIIYQEENEVELLKKNKNFFLLMIYKEKKIKTSKDLILTGGPSISNYEIYNVNKAIMHGWDNNHSSYIKKLEVLIFFSL